MPCTIDFPADLTAIVSFTCMLPSSLTVMRESKERMRSSRSWAAAGASTAHRKQSAAKKVFMDFALDYIPTRRQTRRAKLQEAEPLRHSGLDGADMKVLLIGGSGFIGPFTATELLKNGHQVTVFHRGRTRAPEGAEQILGDRQFLQDHQPEFRRQKFDVVVDFVLSSARQAMQLMDTFRGIAGRVVALSSMDVYRAW